MHSAAKVRLKNSVFIVPMAAQQLQIRIGERTLKISGAQVELLTKVVAALSTAQDVQQLVAHLPQHAPESIIALLEKLETLNLLENPSEQAPAEFTEPEAAYYASQLQFFAHRAQDRFAFQTTLKQSRVTVVGLGRIGALVSATLLTSGVGHLHLVDARSVDTQDIGALYGAEDLGKPRTEALQARLQALNPFVQITTARPRSDQPEDLGQVISGDFVVVCEDEVALRIYETVNEICLRKRTKWLAVHLARQQGVIGPLVIPGETPCYRCYKLREKSNAAHLQEYEVFDEYLRNNPDHKVKQGSLRPFDAILGSVAALEVVHALTQLADAKSVGSLVVFDFASLALEEHPILRLPRCPACSSARDKPKRKIYDI